MNTNSAKIVACLVMVAAVAICWQGNTTVGSASAVDLPTQYAAAGQGGSKKKDKKTNDVVEPPSGSSGTLGVRVGSFTSGNAGQTCFPFSQGWDRYYSTQFFRGPFATQLQPNPFPNTGHVASVTIDTIHPSNGTTLVTGIVIAKNGYPNVKVCGTNVGALINPQNPNLSKATFAPTQTGVMYRVTIFYKSSTAAGLTNVFFNWSYP